MKHANAEMIKAVLDNTELAILCEVIDDDDGNYWSASSLSNLVSCFNKFFVCLPKHKKAVLEKLNGGECQFLPPVVGDRDWTDSENHHFESWSDGWWYMDDRFESRIKPKKEKRWIGLSSSSCHTTGHYETKLEAVNVTEEQPWAKAYRPWHFLEIEIEIEV